MTTKEKLFTAKHPIVYAVFLVGKEVTHAIFFFREEL
jgi:hypothetical protein